MFSWLSGVILKDVVNSDDLCGMVLELVKYYNGSICTTFLMRIYRRVTLYIGGCLTILIFSLSSRSCIDYVWLNMGIIESNSILLKGNL